MGVVITLDLKERRGDSRENKSEGFHGDVSRKWRNERRTSEATPETIIFESSYIFTTRAGPRKKKSACMRIYTTNASGFDERADTLPL